MCMTSCTSIRVHEDPASCYMVVLDVLRKAPMPLEELNTCARYLLWGACTGAHADRETQPRKLKQRQILTLHRTQTHTHTQDTD